jgi:arginase
LGVLWVDAHADMNTPAVRPTRVALVGIRSLDVQEKVLVRDSGVHVFTMSDIDRLGLAAVTQRALALILRGRADLHVSFDLDVCDPAIAPGVGTPVPGGLSYREAHMLLEMVAETGRLRALDLVEVNPTLDTHNATAELAVALALSAFGQRVL